MFNFDKRISGKTYYIRVILSYIAMFAVALTVDLLPDESTAALAGFILLMLIMIFWLVFLISQIRQRANDIGKHPFLLTVLSFWTPLFLILGFIPGQKEPNKYGAIPKS
jgi:uncharacterized membrane protein YhaH (DUF805 family)